MIIIMINNNNTNGNNSNTNNDNDDNNDDNRSSLSVDLPNCSLSLTHFIHLRRSAVGCPGFGVDRFVQYLFVMDRIFSNLRQ